MTRTALWQSIAETLSAEVAAGHWGAGDRLPTEAALARRFGVNRHTVRRALARLADLGLVHARRGAGVFVAGGRTDYPLGPRVRFHQNLQAAGRVPGRRILALGTRRADAEEAAALALDAEERVHVCDGVSLADGVPIAIFRSVFPAARFPELPAILSEESSITRALARLGVADVLRAATRISAVTATAAQAVHLRVRQGDPLLLSVAVNTDAAGRPVEYGTTWFAGDRVSLTLDGSGFGADAARMSHA
jgi:GntR family phosphonate transport system transcriptional regulator